MSVQAIERIEPEQTAVTLTPMDMVARAVAQGSSINLLPCPFCGGAAEVREYPTARMAWVTCLECRLEYPPQGQDTEVETGTMAAAEWNRRATNPEMVKALKTLRGFLSNEALYLTSADDEDAKVFTAHVATIDALLIGGTK